LLLPVDRLILTAIDEAGVLIERHVDGVEVADEKSLNFAVEIGDVHVQDVDRYRINFVVNGEDYERRARVQPGEDLRYAAGLRAVLSIPLIWRGELVGGLTFRSTNPDAYGQRDIEIAEQIGN
jgi:GAF domain-containing protein